jgi:hypothetical protein
MNTAARCVLSARAGTLLLEESRKGSERYEVIGVIPLGRILSSHTLTTLEFARRFLSGTILLTFFFFFLPNRAGKRDTFLHVHSHFYHSLHQWSPGQKVCFYFLRDSSVFTWFWNSIGVCIFRLSLYISSTTSLSAQIWSKALENTMSTLFNINISEFLPLLQFFYLVEFGILSAKEAWKRRSATVKYNEDDLNERLQCTEKENWI